MKKTLILFASRGHAAKNTAYYVANYLGISTEVVYNVSEAPVKIEELNFEHVILISPTYGDEELEEAMETCMTNTSWSVHKGKTFDIIELGLYRGYDFSVLGAARIMQLCMEKYGLVKTSPVLSLDSVPNTSTDLLEKWLKNNM
jgi:flavodoxin